MTIVYFILAALVLGFLVLIHELGHLLAAKLMGMEVESFSIGFGPALLQKRWRNVEYRISIIPFGGYVRIKGMEKSKNSNESQQSVYDIPNGFFSKAPWKRIIVLLAGPFANILLACVAFSCLYASGGRNKPFSEFTSIIGWANPRLEEKGLQLGAQIISCNGKDYQGDKDALSAAVLDGHLDIVGKVPSYLGLQERQFSFSTPFNPVYDGYPCLGANYLLLRHDETLNRKSPIYDAGLIRGDRLVWMDGELLFSLTQLSQMLNESYAFVKVSRQGKEFWTRQPRVFAKSLRLSSYVRNELIDTQFEAGIKGKWSSLYILPYVINSYGYVEGILDSIDPESSLPKTKQTLELGDRILAIDGIPVNGFVDILRLVQTHKVSIIVQNVVDPQIVNPQLADKHFIEAYESEDLLKIVQSLGSDQIVFTAGTFRLLPPIQPLPWISIYPYELLIKQKEAVSKIKGKDKQRFYLEKIEAEKNRLSLGLPLQDMQIQYNPTPLTMLTVVTKDSLRTVKALFVGKLSPRWLSGPIGIVKVLHTGWSIGLSEALYWMGLISMNLAVINLLPIPVLDGGYVFLNLWEVITRRRLNMRIVEKILIPFMILLALFFIFLTFQDLFLTFLS